MLCVGLLGLAIQSCGFGFTARISQSLSTKHTGLTLSRLTWSRSILVSISRLAKQTTDSNGANQTAFPMSAFRKFGWVRNFQVKSFKSWWSLLWGILKSSLSSLVEKPRRKLAVCYGRTFRELTELNRKPPLSRKLEIKLQSAKRSKGSIFYSNVLINFCQKSFVAGNRKLLAAPEIRCT